MFFSVGDFMAFLSRRLDDVRKTRGPVRYGGSIPCLYEDATFNTHDGDGVI